MAKTLLQLVQGVQRKLRSDPAGALVAGQLETDSIVDLVNDAKDEVLHERTWDFDIRHDEQAHFPGRIEPDDATASNLSLAVTFTLTSAQVGQIWNTQFHEPVMRVRVINDTTQPEVSYLVRGIPTVIGDSRIAVLQEHYLGVDLTPAGTAEVSLFCEGVILPSSVRRILSVRHYGQPLRLEFREKFISFDDCVPRPHDSFSTTPQFAIVSGNATSTADTSTTYPTLADRTEGTLLSIWPLADAPHVVVDYSYVYRHANLEVATPTGTLSQVPEPVENLIEWVAFQLALLSNMEADPVRFEATRRKVDARIARLYAQHRPDPLRRDEARPWDRPHKSRDPRWRWDSQSITAPS